MLLEAVNASTQVFRATELSDRHFVNIAPLQFGEELLAAP